MATFMLVNIVILGDALFLPTINDVYKLFPNSGMIVNFAVSGNYLMIVFASILAGKLCRIIGQKIVIIAGSICALTGGVLLLAIENVYFMCAMRLLFAFGFGFCQVSCISFINGAYPEPGKRGSMTGYFNAARYTLGAGLGVLGGKLAVISARTAYRGYWIILPVIVLVIFFLPNIKPVKLKATGHEEQPKSPEPGSREKKQGFGGLYWSVAICLSLFYFTLMFITFFVSVYVAENALGTPAVAGYAGSIFTIGSAISSFAFGKIYRKTGKTTILLTYIGTALIYFVFMIIPTSAVLYITSFFRGGLYGLGLTYCYSILPTIVPKERSNDAVAFLTAMYSFAMFISPFAVTWAIKFIGKGRYTPTIIIPVIICAAIFFVQLVLNKKQAKEGPA
ncbi:MAG: MFS transporter [Treponema sp.]|nr:MFS transporter [Treponema sp.]